MIADVTADEARTRSLVASCDAVLPACEDAPTLAWLAERVPGWGVPFLFDLEAYRVCGVEAGVPAALRRSRCAAAGGVARVRVPGGGQAEHRQR